MADLDIVPGRVVHATARHATVEFAPGQLPAPHTPLQSPAGLLEVLWADNPSEVRCAVRRGEAPQVGTVVTGAGTLPPAVEPLAEPDPEEQILLGHVGVDALAPLFWRGSLAVYGAGARDSVARLLEGLDPLVIEADGPAGAAALQLREAIAQMAHHPHRVVWLRAPEAHLTAWLAVDGLGRPGDIALQTLRWSLYRLCGLGAVVADIADRPDAVTVPDRLWTSTATTSNGILQPLSCRTRGPVSVRRRRNISRIQKLLASAATSRDHAAIFGFDELDEARAEALRDAGSLTELLTGDTHDDLATLDDLIESRT